MSTVSPAPVAASAKRLALSALIEANLASASADLLRAMVKTRSPTGRQYTTPTDVTWLRDTVQEPSETVSPARAANNQIAQRCAAWFDMIWDVHPLAAPKEGHSMSWSGWKRTTFGPGVFHPASAPAASGYGDVLDVVCQEDKSPNSGNLWEQPYLGNDYWSPFSDIGQPQGRAIIGSPALTSSQDGDRHDLFVNAATGLLHRSMQRPYPWSDWEDLGGGPPGGPILGSSPAACVDSDGRLDVFCISGTDFSLLHKRYRNGRWSDWESLGGNFRRQLTPAAQTWGGGRVGVFVVGNDLGIHHKWTAADGAGWSGWEDIGGVTERGIAACSWSPGRIDLFHRGEDRAVYHKWFDGGWSGWESLGGVTDHGITTGSRGPGRVDALVIGTDSELYINEL